MFERAMLPLSRPAVPGVMPPAENAGHRSSIPYPDALSGARMRVDTRVKMPEKPEIYEKGENMQILPLN